VAVEAAENSALLKGTASAVPELLVLNAALAVKYVFDFWRYFFIIGLSH
jgi:hypothetical protein